MRKLYNSTGTTFDALLLTDATKRVYRYSFHNSSLKKQPNETPDKSDKNITYSISKLSAGTANNTFHYYNYTKNSSISFLISARFHQQGYKLAFQELLGHSTPAKKPLSEKNNQQKTVPDAPWHQTFPALTTTSASFLMRLSQADERQAYAKPAGLDGNLNFLMQLHKAKDRFARRALSLAQNPDKTEVPARECSAFATETRLPEELPKLFDKLIFNS